MNREDREYIQKIKSAIKENMEIAKRDEDRATDTNDASYYAGLHDAYEFVYEIVRKLK